MRERASGPICFDLPLPRQDVSGALKRPAANLGFQQAGHSADIGGDESELFADLLPATRTAEEAAANVSLLLFSLLICFNSKT
jgi:hypothetical protein